MVELEVLIHHRCQLFVVAQIRRLKQLRIERLHRFEQLDGLLEKGLNESCRASSSIPAVYFEECANRSTSRSHF